jgi:hypothetical protein
LQSIVVVLIVIDGVDFAGVGVYPEVFAVGRIAAKDIHGVAFVERIDGIAEVDIAGVRGGIVRGHDTTDGLFKGNHAV